MHVKILKIVVASPSDVQAERDLVESVVKEVNRNTAADRGLRLEVARWETDTHPGFHKKGPQALIDPILDIENCDILIGIFWTRFGTPTEDAKSGTEHEFLTAYKAWKEKDRPQIMVYFNQRAYTPTSKAETDQWGQVLEFKENFPSEGLWWEYEGTNDFAKLIRNHLTSYIRNYPTGNNGGPPPTEEPPDECHVPIGIFAMTEAEAEELFLERIVNHRDWSLGDQEDYETLKKSLEECDLIPQGATPEQVWDALKQYYQPDRDAWRPAFSTEETIRDVVKDIVETLNRPPEEDEDDVTQKEAPEASQMKLQPLFLSTELFSNGEVLDETRSLLKSGGLLIIDTLSLFHPPLRKKLQLLELSGESQVSIVTLSPWSPTASSLNKLIEAAVMEQLMLAWKRFEKLKPTCEVGIGDQRRLKRWLYSILPVLAKQVSGPNRARQEAMRARFKNRGALRRMYPERQTP